MTRHTLTTARIAIAVLALCLSQALQALTLRTVAEDLGIPWAMTWVNKDTLLFTERDGGAGLLNIESGSVRWLSGLPDVHARGQGGLLDVATAPDYQPGDWIYFTYSKPVGDSAATTLARAKLADQRLVDWQDMLITQSTSDTNRHFGSRIAFDGRGHLFFSVGDRGHRPNGQDLLTHAGSILRLTLDGEVPADNPFVGRDDALPEIYSYGHRNPQGLCFDTLRNGLWAGEHGPRGGDEMNWIVAGENYGWATVSHGKEYWGPIAVGEAKHKEGMVDPRHVYIPSIAPGSLLCYRQAGSAWHGDLLQGALKLTHLNRLVVDDEGQVTTEERLLEDRPKRIRALLQGRDGTIYFSTDNGEMIQLIP